MHCSTEWTTIPLPHKFHGHFDFALVCRLTWRELASSQRCLLRQECSLSPFTQADLIECFNVSFSEKAMAPHSSTLAWKIRWTEEPGGLPSMGSQRVRHDWATELNWMLWVTFLMYTFKSYSHKTFCLFFYSHKTLWWLAFKGNSFDENFQCNVKFLKLPFLAVYKHFYKYLLLHETMMQMYKNICLCQGTKYFNTYFFL